MDRDYELWAAFFMSRLTWLMLGLVLGFAAGYAFARGW